MEKEYALVLAGGGTKGAYQVGVWKAIKELNLNVKAIVGASIGAINGAFILQDDMDKWMSLYENIKISDIMEISDKIDPDKNLFDISNLRKLAKDYIEKRGLENTPLKETLIKNIDIEKVFSSEIDFGLVTYSLKNRVPIKLFKNEIPKDELIDFILASSCFPIFKAQNVNGIELVDGGFYDNAPINMLIEKGYKNIIVADVEGVGVNRKIEDKNVYLKVISPSENLGGLFNFNHEKIKSNMVLGYLDTMKKFNKMQGHYYYFPSDEFDKMLDEFNLQTIYGLERAAKFYKLERNKPYDFEEFINELYNKHEDVKNRYQEVKNKIINKKFNLKESINGEFGICLATDIYLNKPTAKKLKVIEHILEDVESLLELENYMK